MSRLACFLLRDRVSEMDASLDPAKSQAWPQRGLTTSFPLLNAALDGYRNHVYAVAGGSRMGKTTLLLQHGLDFLKLHSEARVIMLSLDQPCRDIHLKLVGMAGQCALDYLIAPTPDNEAKYEKKKKQRGLKRVGELKDRFWLVDESDGAVFLEEVAEFCAELRGQGDFPIFVLIDPVFKLRCREVSLAAPLESRVAYLVGELKTMCLRHQVGVILSTRLDSGAGATRPTLSDLEGQSTLLYEAAAVMLMYNDAANDATSPFLEWEWGTDDQMVPILELNVAKNKMGAFSGRLFYRFYQSFSMFKECSRLEVENFNRMLDNLRAHSGQDEKKDVPMPVVEDVSAT